jgi:hypothetical protein
MSDEEYFQTTDEIEDPMYGMTSDEDSLEQYHEEEEAQTLEENLLKMLIVLAREVEEGRLPLIQSISLIRETREASPQEAPHLTKRWRKVLKRGNLQQDQRAILWRNFLLYFKLTIQGIEGAVEEMALWASLLRN